MEFDRADFRSEALGDVHRGRLPGPPDHLDSWSNDYEGGDLLAGDENAGNLHGGTFEPTVYWVDANDT